MTDLIPNKWEKYLYGALVAKLKETNDLAATLQFWNDLWPGGPKQDQAALEELLKVPAGSLSPLYPSAPVEPTSPSPAPQPAPIPPPSPKPLAFCSPVNMWMNQDMAQVAEICRAAGVHDCIEFLGPYPQFSAMRPIADYRNVTELIRLALIKIRENASRAVLTWIICDNGNSAYMSEMPAAWHREYMAELVRQIKEAGLVDWVWFQPVSERASTKPKTNPALAQELLLYGGDIWPGYKIWNVVRQGDASPDGWQVLDYHVSGTGANISSVARPGQIEVVSGDHSSFIREVSGQQDITRAYQYDSAKVGGWASMWSGRRRCINVYGFAWGEMDLATAATVGSVYQA